MLYFTIANVSPKKIEEIAVMTAAASSLPVEE